MTAYEALCCLRRISGYRFWQPTTSSIYPSHKPDHACSWSFT